VTDERETLSYADFGTAARELAQQVADSGFEPDMILSIARGGLFLGGALGYALDVKNLFVMNVEFYTGVDQRLELPVVLPPTLDVVDLTGSKVLIADDVADTGKTLQLVEEFCAGHVTEVRTAVVYEKPRSLVSCDYVWKRTDAWIDFPWSALPPVRRNAGAQTTSR
jgi:hypoxanthine phosphoribosyltransferase